MDGVIGVVSEPWSSKSVLFFQTPFATHCVLTIAYLDEAEE
jgi:hypothetical protein